MPDSQANPWRRRLRRLLFFAGTATSIYLVAGYALDRMREARLRAVKERRERDMLKTHFTSLISTISFTLYALLPTLQPQVSAAHPVEATSQALQGLSAPSSLNTSTQITPDSSQVLQQKDDVPGLTVESGPGKSTGVGENWASEFQVREGVGEGEPSLVGSSLAPTTEVDDAASSTLSQSMSLPPTENSSFSNSPPSDLSHFVHLESSPPGIPPTAGLQVPNAPVAGQTKKELWRDLKIQTLSRSLTTAYLIPLLHILTSSQLSTLARMRYMADVKSTLPKPSDPHHSISRSPTSTRPGSEGSNEKKSWFNSFTIDAMGLSEFVETHAPSIIPSYLNPVSYIPAQLSGYLPSFLDASSTSSTRVVEHPIAVQMMEEQIAAEQAEDERVFLSYSWWLLHEGWRGVSTRVEEAVEEVFEAMPLKRELTVQDWETLIREIRARVETESTMGQAVTLYSFSTHLLPPNPLPPLSPTDPCPLPNGPPVDRPHLLTLLAQTLAHLTSPDAGYLIEKGVSAMIARLLETLGDDVYSGSEIGLILGEGGRAATIKRRLVDCLPTVDRWGKSVWEGIPDNGVEAVLAIPEFEAFAALIFGDWAPRR